MPCRCRYSIACQGAYKCDVHQLSSICQLMHACDLLPATGALFGCRRRFLSCLDMHGQQVGRPRHKQQPGEPTLAGSAATRSAWMGRRWLPESAWPMSRPSCLCIITQRCMPTSSVLAEPSSDEPSTMPVWRVEPIPACELAHLSLCPASGASKAHESLLSLRAPGLCVATCRAQGPILGQFIAGCRVQQGHDTGECLARRCMALHAQVWLEYARWHAADGGGGPQQAASILARARKVSICMGLHASAGCCKGMIRGTACPMLAHVLHAPKPVQGHCT